MGNRQGQRSAKDKQLPLWNLAEDDPQTPAETEWVAISTGASREEKDGHFHWQYRQFFALGEQNPVKAGWLIGNKRIGGPRSIPLFAKRAHARRFKVGLQSICDFNFRGVKNALERVMPNRTGFVQIYEGSLADLCLTLYLAPRLSSTTFFFNFFWPRQWSQLVRKHRRLWRLMRPVFQNSAPNIVLLADTPKYAALMSSATGCRVDPFPVFTPFQFAPVRAHSERTTDLLIIVKRPEDLDFAQKVLMALPQGILAESVITGPETVLDRADLHELTQNLELTFITKALPDNDYVELLNSTKVVFLPYLKEHYNLGSSGKLVEACQAGCSVLVPEESGLSSQIKDTDRTTWATFSHSEPQLAARNLARLIQVFPEPEQRLHSKEQALASLTQRHLQRLRDAHHLSAGTASHWTWIVALTVGFFLSIATYWERENLKKRAERLIDPLLSFLRLLATRRLTSR